MFNALKPWHVIVVVVVLVMLFGAKRLPDTARSVGRSLRILKAETRALGEDDRAARAEVEPSYVVSDEHASPLVAAPAKPGVPH